MNYCAGIDEAGRGCVLGPLVIAIVCTDPPTLKKFARWGVKDSKLLSPIRRKQLAEQIRSSTWHAIQVFEPIDIDTAVRDRSRTLNGLELEGMSHLLDRVRAQFPTDTLDVIVDAPSRNTAAIHAQLLKRSRWQNPLTLHAENFADKNHGIVAAASIIAKVERDTRLLQIEQKIGIPIGCGYPHDPLTRTHLTHCELHAPHVRWSWQTAISLRGTNLLS